MRKSLAVLLTGFLCLIIAAGYGKSNVMEKKADQSPAQNAVPAGSSKAAVVNPCANTPYHPFTIHLEMNMYKDFAVSSAETCSKLIGGCFITKTPIANSYWFSVDHGAFRNAKEAVASMQELKKKGLIPKDSYVGPPAPFAVEIYSTDTREKALKELYAAKKAGASVYILEESAGCFRVLSGAFPNREAAASNEKELRGLGLNARVAPR